MSKRPGGVMPLVPIDSESRQPVFLQLYNGIRSAILQGRIKPGARLPSTRSVSAELRISRNTVLAAFDQLVAEGYLQGRVGSGTHVTQTVPEEMLRVAQTSATKNSRRGVHLTFSRKVQDLAAVPTRISPIGGGHARPFRVGTPALAEFPIDLWRRVQSHCLSKLRLASLDYGDEAGHPWLRRAISEYVKMARGVNCNPEQVVITTGSQQAIDLIGRALLNPGDSVWMEEPGYLGARGALVAAGARLVPVPVDEDGLRVEVGIKLQRKARLAYVSPSHQLPLGVSMTLSRRLELLRWATETGSWILEDDYDSEFRYQQRPLCSLQGLDATGRVLYVGTFSKVLFPALRLGYLIVPEVLIEPIRMIQHFSISHPPVIEQLTVAEFIREGHFERHIRRMRALYGERQQALIHYSQMHLKGLLEVVPSETGMHLMGWLPQGVSDLAASISAAQAGIEAIPVSAFHLGRTRRDGLLLGYAAFSKKKIEEGIVKLAQALSRNIR